MPPSKIIALWTAPRSISSAFQRTFSQRPDTTAFFEPYFNIYYFSQWRISDKNGDLEKMWDYSPEKAVQTIRSAQTSVAFFKEMADIYLHYHNPEFLASITNTFLLRTPKPL